LILCHNIFSLRDERFTDILVAEAVVVAVEHTAIPVKVLNNIKNFCVKLQGSVCRLLSYWFLCQWLGMGSKINGLVLQIEWSTNIGKMLDEKEKNH
jgi:hypothetical protein